MSVKNHICIVDKAECCGCSACYAVCPQNAISWEADYEGFQYPVVEESKCVNCGLCMKTCPIQRGNQQQKTTAFYAVKHLHEEIRENSSSGGTFSAMAQMVLEHNGVIYGAAFDKDFGVKHIRAADQSWTEMRSSKYVQSDMGDVFCQVKADLKDGREVLFTGTPCQVDGLKNFLKGMDTSKLITADLICHGVPSPGVWKDYLSFVTDNCTDIISKVNFRNKNGCGWHNSTIKIESNDGAILVNESQAQALFFKLFFCHMIIRPSCFSCRYANLNRVGDITIGDYWNIEKYHPELDDDRGTSLVMANTSKGQAFLQSLDQCQIVPVAEAECMQPNLKAPAQDYGGRNKFWRIYRRYGLVRAAKCSGFIENTSLWDAAVTFGIRCAYKATQILLKK